MEDEEDVKKYSDLVQRCADSSTEAVAAVESLVAALKISANQKDGMSLLTVKNYEMLAYMAELTTLTSQMVLGKSIADNPAVLRALRHRVTLEKMRPIEEKLKPQIEKLLSQKEQQNKGVLRARLDQMTVDDNAESASDTDDEEGGTNQKKYVAPKIRAVHYEEDDDRPNKVLEKAKRRAMQSSLIQDLKQQFSDAPEEIREISNRKYNYDRAREKYEEENFTRVRMNKEQKRKSAKLGREETLDDLLQFGNYMMRSEDGRALSTLKRKRVASLGDGIGRKVSKRDKKKIKDAKTKHKKKMIRKRQ